TIRYSLRENRHTTLTVFNSLGQEIRTLVDSPQTAGVHTASWDGRNELGQNVSSGVYLYRLRSGGYVKTMKMVLFE
ncbi:FlgD immunoglobulin-like domain containing protein, partial [Candidatus Latescibacterota bacterium]